MKLLRFLLISFFAMSFSASANMVTGSYVGNGSATQVISGLGTVPTLLLVKGADGSDAWIATSTMASGYAMKLTGTAGVETGLISSLDADGFTVDETGGLSNESGITYYYTAWAGQSVTTGSFTPNDCGAAWATSTWYSSEAVVSNGGTNYSASSGHTSGASDEPGVGGSWATKWTSLGACADFDENIALGFEPGMVWLFGGTSTWYEVTYPQMAMNGAQPGYAHRFNTGARITAATYKILKDFYASGFEVATSSAAGTHSGPSVGVEYHYAAFPDAVSSFTGNNSVAQDISISVDPGFVLIKNVEGTSDNTWWKTVDMPSTTAYKFTDVASTISITGFSNSPQEFSVGTNGEVNGTDDYEFVAFEAVSSLPVELIRFDAEKSNNGVLVSWTTASEIDNDYFDVQASLNGIDWYSIGIVDGSGNTTEEKSYYLMDYDIKGLNFKYFRLIQYDFDGKSSSSNSKVVTLNNTGQNLKAFDDGLNINIELINKGKEAHVKIFDVNGKVVISRNVEGGESQKQKIKFEKKQISAGVYFVKVELDGEVYSTKFQVR